MGESVTRPQQWQAGPYTQTIVVAHSAQSKLPERLQRVQAGGKTKSTTERTHRPNERRCVRADTGTLPDNCHLPSTKEPDRPLIYPKHKRMKKNIATNHTFLAVFVTL